MSTWKQEIAEAITPLEGVNDITGTLAWNITLVPDPYSPIPGGDSVTISRAVPIKGAREVDARLIDGKNYIAGDNITELSYLRYLEARNPLATDPEIISGGKVKTLEDMRPMTRSFGLELGTDTLTIAGETWYICRADADGWQTDEDTGAAVPAKLRLTLRK